MRVSIISVIIKLDAMQPMTAALDVALRHTFGEFHVSAKSEPKNSPRVGFRFED